MVMSVVSRMAAATALLLVLAAVPAAVAVTYKVGDSNGWTTGFDYSTWTAGKTFRVGDDLEFEYGPTHTVDVVTKAGYDNCDPSTASQKFSDGDTKIELKTPGPMYFICPTPGHCEQQMKLAITVVAAGSNTPTTPGGGPSSSPGNTPAGGTSTPPSIPNSASTGLVSYGMMGVSLVFGYAVGIIMG